jgi:cbb3-type cytochrome oxidase subunit 3
VNIILIISIIFLLAVILYFFLENKKKQEQINELNMQLSLHSKEQRDLKEEKEVLDMELGFVKSIYRAKLLHIGNHTKKVNKQKETI